MNVSKKCDTCTIQLGQLTSKENFIQGNKENQLNNVILVSNQYAPLTIDESENDEVTEPSKFLKHLEVPGKQVKAVGTIQSCREKTQAATEWLETYTRRLNSDHRGFNVALNRQSYAAQLAKKSQSRPFLVQQPQI